MKKLIVGLVLLLLISGCGKSGGGKKLVCKSSVASITINYNEKTLTGYNAVGLTYDFEGQKSYADLIGPEPYVDEFNTWFENNTDGTCTKE